MRGEDGVNPKIVQRFNASKLIVKDEVIFVIKRRTYEFTTGFNQKRVLIG